MGFGPCHALTVEKIRREVLVSTGDACAFKTLLNKLYQVLAMTMGRISCSVKLQRTAITLLSTHIATSSCVATPFWLGNHPHWLLTNLPPWVRISVYRPSTRAFRDSSQNTRLSWENVTYMQPGPVRAVQHDSLGASLSIGLTTRILRKESTASSPFPIVIPRACQPDLPADVVHLPERGRPAFPLLQTANGRDTA